MAEKERLAVAQVLAVGHVGLPLQSGGKVAQLGQEVHLPHPALVAAPAQTIAAVAEDHLPPAGKSGSHLPQPAGPRRAAVATRKDKAVVAGRLDAYGQRQLPAGDAATLGGDKRMVEARIAVVQGAEHFFHLVGAGVVHHDYLKIRVVLLQDERQVFAQQLHFVVRHQHHRQRFAPAPGLLPRPFFRSAGTSADPSVAPHAGQMQHQQEYDQPERRPFGGGQGKKRSDIQFFHSVLSSLRQAGSRAPAPFSAQR